MGRVPSQRCSAKSSRTGEPCKRWAIAGGTVCPTHGGRASQVRDAAQRRLAELAPIALEVQGALMQGIATDPSTGEPVAVPPVVRARAAADIMSRAGLAAVQEVVLSDDGPPRPDLDEAIAEVLARRGLAPGLSVEAKPA